MLTFHREIIFENKMQHFITPVEEQYHINIPYRKTVSLWIGLYIRIQRWIVEQNLKKRVYCLSVS